MKKLIIMSIALGFAGCVSLGPPKLTVVGPRIIDAGNVYNTGKPVEEYFELKNEGGKAVHISEVRTSCGCTAALLSDSVLDGGDKTQVKVDFNPMGYIGEVTKYIYVVSDDPSNRMLTLELHAHISYALQATPNFVLFPNARVGETDSAFVTLTNTSADTMSISGVVPDKEEITSHFERKVIKPGENTDLTLYIRAAKPEALSGAVQIRTTSPLQPVLALRYYAAVR